jgi:NADPH:quinone reductase
MQQVMKRINLTSVSAGPALLPVLLTRSVTLQGFIVSNFSDRFDEAMSELTGWVSNDSLKYTETIIEGVSKLPQAFIGLFNGMNNG